VWDVMVIGWGVERRRGSVMRGSERGGFVELGMYLGVLRAGVGVRWVS